MSPEQQAQAATRAAEIGRLIEGDENELASLYREWWNAPAKRLPAYQDRINVLEQHRHQVYEELNAIRARLGLPVVVPPSLQAAAPEGSKVKQGTGWAGLGCLVLLVAGCIISYAVQNSSSSGYVPSTSRQSSSYSVVYLVGGSTREASLTYENANGSSEQRTVGVPWQLAFDAEPGSYLYLSAQNEMDVGSVSCEIRVDGLPVKQATSSGGYVIASCSGRLP